MSRHRAPVRPRYGRIGAFSAAVVVTGTALLGGTGLLHTDAATADRAVGQVRHPAAFLPVANARTQASSRPSPSVSQAPSTHPVTPTQSAPTAPTSPSTSTPTPTSTPGAGIFDGPVVDSSLPSDSGEGRRVVFSQSRQRVWLVDDDGRIKTSYLVSGSVTDNLHPGTYAVFSRSPTATGIDDSGTMRLFVRFTRGDTGAAIGFHDIPIKDGKQIEPLSQLGTPRSHGCIRQRHADAAVMWKFAPLGTTVVVTA